MQTKWDDQPTCSVRKVRGKLASYDYSGVSGYVACAHCAGTGLEPKRHGCAGCLLITVGLMALASFLTGHQRIGGLLVAVGLRSMVLDSSPLATNGSPVLPSGRVKG